MQGVFASLPVANNEQIATKAAKQKAKFDIA